MPINTKYALLTVLIFCALGSVPVSLGQDENPYSCQREQLKTVWAVSNPIGEIEQHTVIFSGLGQTTVDFHFRNRLSMPLRGLMLVMEYEDSQGRVIDRVPISANVGMLTNASDNELTPIRTWKRAISPGDSALMGAVKEGIRTGFCPVIARVIFAKAQFADGTTQAYSSSGWRLEAAPRMIPTLSEHIPKMPVEPPVSIRAKLKISVTGKLVDIAGDEQQRKVLDWIGNQIREWSFYPAFLDGQPVDSDLDVLFLMHAKGSTQFQEPEPVLTPITVVHFLWTDDLFPGRGGGDRWTVVYGLLEEGSINGPAQTAFDILRDSSP